MSIIVNVLQPEPEIGQVFTKKSISANHLLTPLVSDTFTLSDDLAASSPKVWVCDANNKGSLHTFDYSYGATEFTITTVGAPNTTNNTQTFIYYMNIGGSWEPTSMITLPWVTYPTAAAAGSYTSAAALDGQFLWTNFTTPAPAATTVAPYPLTVNTSIAVGNRLNWASVCCGFTTSVARADAIFSCGASLISPSYVLSAWHCTPAKLWFQDAYGDEISRTVVSKTRIDSVNAPDLCVSKLDSPIYTIKPATIASNPQVYGHSKVGYVLELGGRFTTLAAVSTSPFSLTANFNHVEKYNAGATQPPRLQTGNSGHPYVITVAGIQLLCGVMWQGVNYFPGGPDCIGMADFPNIAKYASQVNAVLDDDGECLQLVNVTIT